MRASKWTPLWTADEKVPIRWINVGTTYIDWLRDSQDWAPEYVSTWNTADYVAENICRSFRSTNNRNRTVIYGSTPTSDLPVDDEPVDLSFLDALL